MGLELMTFRSGVKRSTDCATGAVKRNCDDARLGGAIRSFILLRDDTEVKQDRDNIENIIHDLCTG